MKNSQKIWAGVPILVHVILLALLFYYFIPTIIVYKFNPNLLLPASLMVPPFLGFLLSLNLVALLAPAGPCSAGADCG